MKHHFVLGIILIVLIAMYFGVYALYDANKVCAGTTKYSAYSNNDSLVGLIVESNTCSKATNYYLVPPDSSEQNELVTRSNPFTDEMFIELNKQEFKESIALINQSCGCITVKEELFG